jgi:hypothetical protein
MAVRRYVTAGVTTPDGDYEKVAFTHLPLGRDPSEFEMSVEMDAGRFIPLHQEADGIWYPDGDG